MSKILEDIRNLLKFNKIDFQELHHEPTPTSEDSAKARGECISIGGKALVLKIGNNFKLFVVSGDKKLNTKSLKKHFSVKKVRFATHEELFNLTTLKPGSVPPFGKPILPLDLYVDLAVKRNEKIAFNAGSVTDSITMAVDDYLKIAKPLEIFDYSIDK
jgi:Ala-tRNA(Pro) deacylase